jgi:hypothetical protein
MWKFLPPQNYFMPIFVGSIRLRPLDRGSVGATFRLNHAGSLNHAGAKPFALVSCRRPAKVLTHPMDRPGIIVDARRRALPEANTEIGTRA